MPLSRRLVALAVALVGALLVAGPAQGVSPEDHEVAADTADTGGAAATAAAADVAAPVVLIGVTGLRWDDIHTLSTPAMWDLSRRGAVGAVAARSARAAGCPADGWLAVTAGTRLADREDPSRTCRTLRDSDDADPVSGWADYVQAAAEQPYGAEPGALGELLADAGLPVTSIGAGAAIALADSDGVPVGTHLRRPAAAADLERAAREALRTSSLLVVDAGSVRDAGRATQVRPDPEGELPEAEPEEPSLLPDSDDDPPEGLDAFVEPSRAEQLRELDERIDAVLRASRGTGATVLVVSLADSGRAALQVAVATGPAPRGDAYGQNLLTSGTTRQPGVVQTGDVSSTLLTLLDLPVPDAAIGAPMVPTDGPDTGSARVQLLDDISTEARQVTRVSSSYLTRLVLAQAALFVVAALMLTRVKSPRRVPVRLALRGLEVVALALGSAPIASFLVGAVPWWRAQSPVLGFWLVLLAWVAAITTVALAGPWRRATLGPAAVVSGITVATLVVDAIIGSPLVIDSPMGAHRLMAARFYGMSNQAFAILAAGALVLATAVAHTLLERGRRGLAITSVIAIGLLVTVVDGAPGLGSDFGGPPGLLLAFAVLATVVAGRKVRWRTLLVVAVVGGVVVMGFAWLDWLREPADRTHLGRFFATVMDGGLWEVVGRKLEVHLRVLTLWRYLVLAIGGAVVTTLVLRGPQGRGRLRGRGPLAGLTDAVPLVRTCVVAVTIVLGIGFLINDSGIIVPATGIALAVPCLLAAAARRRLFEPDATPDTSAATEPADEPADEPVTEPADDVRLSLPRPADAPG